jgi:hypothetical protein
MTAPHISFAAVRFYTEEKLNGIKLAQTCR